MARYYATANAFVPSGYSYGATEDTATSQYVAEWMPAIRTALGVDDPRRQLAVLENRLRDLTEGTPAERGAAMLASGSLTVQGAINKTRHRIDEIRSASDQAKQRDVLFTALVLSGVAVGGMAAIYLGSRTYAVLRDR